MGEEVGQNGLRIDRMARSELGGTVVRGVPCMIVQGSKSSGENTIDALLLDGKRTKSTFELVDEASLPDLLRGPCS